MNTPELSRKNEIRCKNGQGIDYNTEFLKIEDNDWWIQAWREEIEQAINQVTNREQLLISGLEGNSTNQGRDRIKRQVSRFTPERANRR